MAETPHNIRPYIGIFGKRNVGKSSLINILAEQEVAIVSETAGTTTDPVKKAMEILGLGAVILLDTAGFDDSGKLGSSRVAKTMEAAAQIDLALLLTTNNEWGPEEEKMMDVLQAYKIPIIIVHNKSDIIPSQSHLTQIVKEKYHCDFIDFSTKNPHNLDLLLHAIKKELLAKNVSEKLLFDGLLNNGDTLLLITPIDSEAPKDRLILPQVLAIRQALDKNCVTIVLKETEVDSFLQTSGIIPALAVTDSQLFGKIDKLIDKKIPLTGFSVLLARQKGAFDYYLKSTPKIKNLENNDRILILESCTHHSTCEDIGREKIPRALRDFTGKNLIFDIVAGLSPITRSIEDYALVIQCGGCMVTSKQLQNRLNPFIEAGIPVTNYGMVLAFVKGIYERATAMF